MYVGRIVSIGLTEQDKLCVMYRVSSRSFPNRVISELDGNLSVIPSEGHHSDIYTNPYISYNCLRHNERYAVVGNGTHTDPVFEKLENGMNMRDALANVLLAMDYEHDSYSTPRIAAIVDKKSRNTAIGVVRPRGIEVEVLPLKLGQYRYVTTYEKNQNRSENSGLDFNVFTAETASEFIISKGDFTNCIFRSK